MKAGNEGDIVGYEKPAKAVLVERDESYRLAELVGAALEPSGAKFVLSELAICDAACAARREDDMDAQARAHAFVEHLKEYPEDIIRAVFRKWPRLSEWRPTVRDITVRADKEYARRRSLFTFVQRAVRTT